MSNDILSQVQRPLVGNRTGTLSGFSPSIPTPSQPAAFKQPVTPPFAQDKGPNPTTNASGLSLKFIPPLALFNDASQWVNRCQYVRPMPKQMAPNSLPPLRGQYFTPRPVSAPSFAAGQANLQMQLGTLSIQTARLDESASNYFGG